MKKIVLLAFVSVLLLMMTIVYASNVLAWSNGGYSDDPSNPDYGTHDWIAEHVLDWLPEEEKRYILDNLAAYLYGTELPDNGIAPDGIGDTAKHHIYYWSNGSLQDNASAVRAYEEYNNTLNFLRLGHLANASKTAGIMSHYIVDMAVFGHVMGAGTDWGAEQHHSDYENYVNQRTSSYDAEFNVYLSFDGDLALISAYDAAKELAYDTTFDVDGDLTCVWMNQNYNWSDPVFKNRCGESLNLAVNYLTDVLHTLYLEAMSVHNTDTGLDYLTIQKAINALETLDGHTILVDAGIYFEHVTINKSISLIGENRYTTIIDGNKTGDVIEVRADNVTISGFTIRNGDVYGWHAGWGVYIRDSSGCRVSGNNVIDNKGGICIEHGLPIESVNCIIEDNMLNNNFEGISLYRSDNCTITRNNVTNSRNSGIYLFASSFCKITGNQIENTQSYGIYLRYLSNNNTIYHNRFINNGIQASVSDSLSQPRNNVWDDGYPSGGNYWSDYNGTDLFSGPYQSETESDGIGDKPYDIDENNRDKYPLMGMFYDFRFWDVNIVICNSTIHNFSSGYYLNSTTGTWEKRIVFNVVGPEGTVGFCRIMIPRDFMESPYTVLVNGEEVNATELSISNTTHAFLYFTYTHSGIVMIIPEFPTWTSMLLILILLTVAIAIYNRRPLKTPIH